MVDKLCRPYTDERTPGAGTAAAETVVPVDKAVLDGLPLALSAKEDGLRDPGRPAVAESAAQGQMAAGSAHDDGSADTGHFPAADVAQGSHDLADKGMQLFRTVISIGLDRHLTALLSWLPLLFSLLLRASSGILRSSRRPSADGRRYGSGGVFPESFPAFPGGRLHIPRLYRSPGR